MRLSKPLHKLILFFISAAFLFSCVLPPIFAQDETINSGDPAKLFNQGQDAHEKGDYQNAVKFYDEALKLAPEFPEAEYQKGAALVSLGKNTEAEKAFYRAIELREDWTLPMVSLATLLIDEKKFSDAEKILNKVISLDGKNPDALVALTELRLRTKASAEVLTQLLSELENLSNSQSDASLWAARGAIENALGKKESAKKSLNRALSLDPKNSFALSERAEMFAAEGNYQAAISDAAILVRLSPNAQNAKLRLARFYAANGNASESQKILDGLDSSNSEVLSLKNSIFASSTNDVSALEKQLANNAKNALILSRLCNLSRTANPQKALDYCRRASEAEPNNINHAVGYGAALVQARQFESAIILFRKLLQIAPDNFAARANLATALFESKNYSEAKKEYEWIIEKKPNLPAAYFFLAISYDQMGEYMEARNNYQQFLKFADAVQNRLEIEKVNLRLPALEKLIKQKGRKQ